MKKMLILAAVAALSAACHNRSQDEVGAAPNRGDTTTAVTHAIDSTRTGPPGVGGRPGDATVIPDSVGLDSTAVQGTTKTDTTMNPMPQDTLGPREPGAGAIDSSATSDSTAVRSDSASTKQ